MTRLAVLVALAAAFATPASWTDAPSLDRMSCDADAIVWGRVVSVALDEGESGRVSRIVPIQVLKGRDDSGAFLEQSPAALHGGHTRYRQGEEVIVFLKGSGTGGRYRTLGRAQGKLLVADGVVTRVAMPVDAFLARLGQALRACAVATEPRPPEA